MKKMQWDDSLSVGVPAIDEQHQQWMRHYNAVVVALEEHHGPAPVAGTLGFLIDYTGHHFATEEGFMEKSGYPGMGDHKAQHDELKESVQNLVLDFEEEGETSALEEAVETFLGTWLIDHIQNTDMLFGAYVKENGIVL